MLGSTAESIMVSDTPASAIREDIGITVRFYYNSAVNNINTTIIHNVYNRSVNAAAGNRVSFNGGQGGTSARATAAEIAASRERHRGPTAAQNQLRRSASTNHAQLASVSHGHPPVLATQRPGAFSTQAARPAHRAGAGIAGNHAARNTQASRTPNHIATGRRGGFAARNVPNAANPPRHAMAPSHPTAPRQASAPRFTQHNPASARHATPAQP